MTYICWLLYDVQYFSVDISLSHRLIFTVKDTVMGIYRKGIEEDFMAIKIFVISQEKSAIVNLHRLYFCMYLTYLFVLS